MASIKKELKAIVKRFDAAQEAFIEGNAQAEKKTKKSKKKLKSAKAKIKSLEQKVASLEQELKVARKKADAAPQINSTADDDTQTKAKSKKSKKKSGKTSAKTPKSTGARRGRPRKSDSPTAKEMATAVSGAPDSVSEAAAEKTSQSGSTDSDATATSATKPRRGRPSKQNSTTAKKPRKSRGPGRPSTKAPASPLTQISGVGATMATRFEEAGVTSVEQFSNLSDDDMKEVLQKCGPRYRSADHDRMEGYRQAAREAMSNETAEA